MKKIFLTVLVVLLAVSLFAADKMSYKAGTYKAAAKGMNGDVNVLVTFSKSAIKKIEIGKHSETPGISDAPIKQIPVQILKTQSLAVDTVSGATLTSKAILEAVASAVQQAGGDVNALKAKKK
ncbi:FMN-binding protein [Treponema sp. HNW]|uniref:FMN-binding protein n=1 Tax=Treponema sp. HNW TaxID=3116654 RepID=UPI003D1282C6